MVCKLQTPNVVSWLESSLEIHQHFVHRIALKSVVDVVWMHRFLDEPMEMRKSSFPLVVSVKLKLI